MAAIAARDARRKQRAVRDWPITAPPQRASWAMPRERPRDPIYLAADPVEAQIVANLLAAERIECDVLGSLLWGGRGEIAADPWPRLVLRDARDEPRARELIDEYRARRGNPAPDWTCACGERVPGNFAACWACGEVPE